MFLKAFSRYKDKACMKDVTFIRSIPVSHAENSVLTLFFSGRKKVIRQTTSEFDVYEVDLDVQMTFLNAATWSFQSQKIKIPWQDALYSLQRTKWITDITKRQNKQIRIRFFLLHNAAHSDPT